MVLGTKTAQYAFLQTLANTYVWTIYDYLSLGCIANPQIYTDCTDYSQWNPGYIPYLPTSQDFYTDGTTQTYTYSDYTSVTFSGITASTFAGFKHNLTIAVNGVLAAACSANTTCATAFVKTPNATQVISALANTNINTIQAQLKSVKNAAWFPGSGYAFYSQVFVNLPPPDAEVFGMHNSIVNGIAARKINGSTYLDQISLGYMLQGGFAIYEALIHTAAIGSWYDQQSNVNLTGTQLFTNVVPGGGIDSKRSIQRSTRYPGFRDAISVDPLRFENKWQVWYADAQGPRISNKEEVFASIKQRSRGHGMTANQLFHRSPNTFCTAPGDLISGINWLQGLNTACNAESFLSGAASIGKAFSTRNGALNKIATSGLPPEWYGRDFEDELLVTVTGVLGGWCATFCGSGELGHPCYLGTQAWTFISSEVTIISLLANVAEFSNPVGAVLGSADLFCALAPIAADYFLKDYQCCSISCNGVSCQSSVSGCTQGTGLC